MLRIILVLAAALLLQNGGNPVGQRSLREVAVDLKRMADELAAHAERLANEESEKDKDGDA